MRAPDCLLAEPLPSAHPRRLPVPMAAAVALAVVVVMQGPSAHAQEVPAGTCAAPALITPALQGIFTDDIADRLSEQDMRCVNKVLDEAPPGQTARWRLEDGSLFLMTAGRPLGSYGVRLCRNLRITVVDGVERARNFVVACRVGVSPWGPTG
ncbi:hypothetical protein WG926_08565 [Tistrella sp. BH-R2-4]|uniref:Uncharacterized protein n=1 Tax=Tistrella arctica TaxID=3133430 RepID=A0ABU9YHU1_9PROT